MILDDIYSQIAYGELRSVVLGTGVVAEIGDEEGLPRENYEKIYPFLILGLTELHKRFLLRERELTIDLQDNQVSYILTYDFAVSNTKSSEDPKYILDSSDTFQDDLMRIERIYGTYSAKEYEIPLNEIDNAESIRTTSYNQFVIPSDTDLAPWLLETSTLRVVYRADHPTIRSYLLKSKPGRTTITLPSTHLEALVWYIASRATNPKGAGDEFHEGNNYAKKFEMACAQLKSDNYEVASDSLNNKLSNRGFV